MFNPAFSEWAQDFYDATQRLQFCQREPELRQAPRRRRDRQRDA